ncbi:hypothetical protein CC1G_11399 [Coprinopsis cinerea okayama7|uniref:TFIIS N-terminal domain-containing protein n=1 Tax=Coprinopsis cinerea (strain Okayama-7 / 130 / ATCC MYA-4618 / FGSC 9003) TaxID=240176 RepID=A8PGK9_COPC7|nr:hypothetical protein CC1G_11399 [Coprinopsis cinerea okayama7\|eukprot:XP_001841236.2 hypothetical protein CC1G_11399 [Coprinopsis cinerea okayama7\
MQQQQEQQRKEQEALERKEKFQTNVRSLLQTFSGGGSVNALVKLINDYGVTEVDAPMRLEILNKMRDNAGNHYFRAWSEKPAAVEITREWLKAAAKGEKPNLEETIMPLLHVIDRLPFTLETLTASKIGKVVRYINKETAFSPAIKDMASNLESRWRQMLTKAGPDSKAPPDSAEDPKSKKRKLNDIAASKGTAAPSGASAGAPPAKKPAVGTATSSKPVVKKEGTTSVKPPSTTNGPKDAKTDTSFFSAPKAKPKTKLPSFKKAPLPAGATVKKEEPNPNVAQPSAVDPFQELLKSMKPRKDSPAIGTPPAVAATPPGQGQVGQPGIGKNGKPKKVVKWAPDEQLEAIRWIERAVYDDDPLHGTRTAHNFRDLDRGEGAALHTAVFEELVDWSEPQPLELEPDVDHPRGLQSEEAAIQEKREQTALSALYMSAALIPETPGEPASVLSEEEVDANVTHMTAGPVNDSEFWVQEVGYMQHQATVPSATSVTPTPGATANNPNVALLIQQLAMGGNALEQQTATINSAVAAMPSDQLAHLLSQLQGNAGMTTQYGQAPYGDDQNPAWSATPNHFPPPAEYGQGYHDDSEQGRHQWRVSLHKEGEHQMFH